MVQPGRWNQENEPPSWARALLSPCAERPALYTGLLITGLGKKEKYDGRDDN